MKGEYDDVGEHKHEGSPSYAQRLDGHLPLHWLQPVEATSTESVLPSFCDLQLKTHRTLYGTTSTKLANGRFLPPSRDKSPKGSVDAPIQHLVDLLNCHSRFCTLSSCSGRLSLFDPNGNDKKGETDNTTADHFNEASGKGRGRWVLVSHEPVNPEELVEAMKETSPGTTSETTTVFENDNGGEDDDSDEENDDSSSGQQPWTFRFEPLLLHIAAASLVDGRKLLTVALNMGFRESGLVVTDKRVTVAIRSNSLTTVTPLVPWTTNHPTSSCDSSLCAPDAFLRALVKDANQRLHANWKHLDRLYRSIESDLFAVRLSPPPIVVRSSSSRKEDIPSLNLWNASAIATKTPNTQQIWVVGGYGCGPISIAGAAAKRSSKLYQLERHGCGGAWREKGGWREYDPRTSMPQNTRNIITEQFLEIESSSTNGKKEKKTLLNVDWCQTVPDLQGMASCQLKPSNLTFAWGGRKSPARPSPTDDLYIFDPPQTRFGIASDVHGDLPKPRWGHQLLALGEDRAVLVGGCNYEDGALDDIFVLHFVSENGEGHFYWEKLCTRLPTPRFHFGATVLKNDTLLLVGGIESTKHLLQPFEDDDFENESPIAKTNRDFSLMWAYRFGRSKSKKSTGNSKIRKTKISRVIISKSLDSRGSGSSNEGWSGSSFLGLACCTLLSGNLLVVTGGIKTNDESSRSSAIQAFWVSSSNNNGFSDDQLLLREIELGFDQQSNNNGTKFDFGSLVHHCCLSVGDNEMLLLGGGVPSFAFGESYARYILKYRSNIKRLTE